MKRVLIVSPHFPPLNMPDMHRVRASLAEFLALGWEPTVLTVDDPTPQGPVEEELLRTIPPAVRVVRVRCLSRRWTRRLGIGNVAWRALPFLFAAGSRLLAGRRFDVVYFSTTMFIVLPFGRLWRAQTGVPYVVDLQDPWVTDYYARPGAPRPPGGWKYGIVNRLGRLLERWSLGRAAHVISVSADYLVALRARYPEFSEIPSTVLPFGAPDGDFAHLRRLGAARPSRLAPGAFRIVFAGAIGPGMHRTLETALAAVAQLRQQGLRPTVHFFGTSYAGTGRGARVTDELARRYGLTDVLTEESDRLPYFDALQVTLEAEVNLILGSSDLSFTPSKIMGVLAAGRPVLAIAHDGSAMTARLAALGQSCITLAGSAPSAAEIDQAAAELRRLASAGFPHRAAPANLLTATAAAQRQAEIFAAAARTTT